MRTFIHVLAVATILVGGWALVAPRSASADPEDACCTVSNGECCGDKCWITDKGCTACRGLACLL